jgi:hypothetical protein
MRRLGYARLREAAAAEWWVWRHARTVRDEMLLRQIPVVTAWVEMGCTPKPVTVSVVTPTRNRCHLLQRAITSVRNQRWDDWEHIIVNDGSTDATGELLEQEAADPRVTVLTTSGVGVAAARNLALKRASGSLITYLDDDNVMAPVWLKAVAWAFDTFPLYDVLYGARLAESEPTLPAIGAVQFPTVLLSPFVRASLLRANYVDVGTVAHRAGLPEANFDESLSQVADWDLIVRLTRTTDPLVLPTVACIYSTRTPGRLSDRPGAKDEIEQLRRRILKGDLAQG